nr:unnamed protein product [Digitaria exilis]
MGKSRTRLVSLPREIHERIISFLPIRDAVRTSAVYRAWRHRWKSAPGLAHDWDCDEDPSHVDTVLAHYSCPVSSFFFDLPEAYFQRADDWIPLLAAKEVEKLTFHFSQDNDDEDRPHYMDVSVFSCQKLTSLNLIGCDIPAAPLDLAGFPNLTKLFLEGVGFPDNGVRGLEALIAGSPLLQLLWLEMLRFHGSEEWVIQAPNLQDLTIVSEYDDGWQIVDQLPHIKKVDIHSDIYTNNRDFVKLLTRVAGVGELRLKMPDTAINVLEGLACSFENLRTLSLKTDFCLFSTILSTMCLLKNAPNLEKLSIQILQGNQQSEEVGVDLLNAQWTDGLLARLKSVSLDMATCESNEMHFIEFVLSKARRLQKFHICAFECSRSNEELLVEILKYRRASAQAQVFFERL